MNQPSEISEDNKVDAEFLHNSTVKIDEGDRLKFARQILFFLAIICGGIFVAYARYPDNTALAAIFELIKIGALPLVTLVISFYFPSTR